MRFRLFVLLLTLMIVSAGSVQATSFYAGASPHGSKSQFIGHKPKPVVNNERVEEWIKTVTEGDHETQAVIGADDRTRVSPAVGEVAWLLSSFQNEEIMGTCTGTFIGPDVLLTAAHCIHMNEQGGWADFVAVFPGVDGPSEPFGYIYAADYFITTGWAESDQLPDASAAQWDYALVILGEPMGDRTGWLSVGSLPDSLLYASNLNPFTIGYPSDKPEATQWISATDSLSAIYPQFLVHNIDHVSGQSGSALMRASDAAIIGIISFERAIPGGYENVARRIDQQVLDFVSGVCADVGCSFSSFSETDPPYIPEPPTADPPTSSAAFQNTWARTDQPVAQGDANRTWMWGPTAYSSAFTESYAEAPGGQRTVQYFDKSRMEVTDPNGDPNSIWYVTNGLLVNELMTGRLQLGDNSFEQYQPALVNVAGDFDDPTGPTYNTFARVTDSAPLAEGSVITQIIDRNGNVNFDPGFAAQNVTAARYVPETNHTVASVFWNFMNSEGLVFENGSTFWAPLFINPFYATGYPVTEPYWANVKVGGTYRYVLIQVFERRVLTYTPGNGPGWEVEAGNVGQHYYTWRYEQIPLQ